MKINKLLLKISHLFGFRLNEEHQDDIMVNIPTIYHQEAIQEIWDNKCESEEAKWVIDDIINQVYVYFQNNPKTEKCCRNVRKVFVTYYINEDGRNGSMVTTIPYVDGILYNPFEKGIRESLDRNNKIDQLLN